MPEKSIENLSEVFVSDATITKLVSASVRRGELRKLGSRLYTRNLDEEPEGLVKRNWYHLITAYYPDALITDRTGLENRPADDGSICFISEKKRDTKLPGIVFRPRNGPPALESDRPFVGGARLASTARAYLENMRHSRARAGRLPRTLSREDIEQRLDAMLRGQGEAALNRLRDDARAIAPALNLNEEYEELDKLVGALLGTRDVDPKSAVAKARMAGAPFDPQRIVLFEKLFAELRQYIPPGRPTPQRSTEARSTLSFFEAYFSNVSVR